jgi:hypothetical protein
MVVSACSADILIYLSTYSEAHYKLNNVYSLILMRIFACIFHYSWWSLAWCFLNQVCRFREQWCSSMQHSPWRASDSQLVKKLWDLQFLPFYKSANCSHSAPDWCSLHISCHLSPTPHSFKIHLMLLICKSSKWYHYFRFPCKNLCMPLLSLHILPHDFSFWPP